MHGSPIIRRSEQSHVTAAAVMAKRRRRRCRTRSRSQQSIIADRHHQPLGNARGRPAAERQPQMVNDTFQTRGPAGSLRDNPVIKPFGKYPSSTERCTTDEASCNHYRLDIGAALLTDRYGFIHTPSSHNFCCEVFGAIYFEMVIRSLRGIRMIERGQRFRLCEVSNAVPWYSRPRPAIYHHQSA
jgi:hypothetical protein